MDQTTFPTINANRVALRWIRKEDADAMFRIYSNLEVMRYWSTPPLADLDAAKKLVEEIQDGCRRDVIMKWGIAQRSDNSLIGSVTLFNLNWESGRAEVGYALNRESWGHGYMNESLKALLGYAFDALKLRRIEADVDPRNLSSIRTVERLGFKQEGYLRERWHVNGEIQDALFYGLLRRDWEARNDVPIQQLLRSQGSQA